MFKPKTPISGRFVNSSGEWIRTTDLRVMSNAPGAPRKAWHFFQGESPWWTRPNQPSIPSVAVVKEAKVEQYN